MPFVAQDVPGGMGAIGRVRPPGRAWGLAGYSEGGYCAANIALQDPGGYGAAGGLSRDFSPLPSPPPHGNPPRGPPRPAHPFPPPPPPRPAQPPQRRANPGPRPPT